MCFINPANVWCRHRPNLGGVGLAKIWAKVLPTGTASDGTREAVVGEHKIDDSGAKANILCLFGIILIFLSLNESAFGLILGLLGAAVLTMSAWLARDG